VVWSLHDFPFLGILSFLRREKGGLWDQHFLCACVCVCVCPWVCGFVLLNFRTVEQFSRSWV
jgi:hypothetical protein